eukprot:UN31291
MKGETMTDHRHAAVRWLNGPISADLEDCDWLVTASHWQKVQLPMVYWPRTTVLHEGINLNEDFEFMNIEPNESTNSKIDELINIKQNDDRTFVLTYSSRGLEPYRGFDVFMEALDFLFQQPQDYVNDIFVTIVGVDRAYYGADRAESGLS